MILYFILDEFTDNTNGEEARTYADLVTDVLRNPHAERPQGESKIAEMTRQYVRFSVRLSSVSLFVFVDSGFVLSKSQANLLRDVSSGISPTMSTEWPMRRRIEQADTFAASQITFSSGNRPRPHTRLSSPWSWV